MGRGFLRARVALVVLGTVLVATVVTAVLQPAPVGVEVPLEARATVVDGEGGAVPKVPEPASIAILVGSAALLLAFSRRRTIFTRE